MKRLVLVVGCVGLMTYPSLAQPIIVGGPIELHNPHRLGGVPKSDGAMLPTTPVDGGSPLSKAVIPITAMATPTVSMFVDGEYLFVLRGDSLFQFNKRTLELLHSVNLALLAAPTLAPTADNDVRTHTSAPFRPSANLKTQP